MKLLVVVAFLALSAIVLSGSSAEPVKKGKHFTLEDLQDEKFEEEVGFGNWLVRFCSPKNPACTSTQDDWENFVHTDDISLLNLGQVDCHKDEDLCIDYGARKELPVYTLFLEDGQQKVISVGKHIPTKQLWKEVATIVDGKVTTLYDTNFEDEVAFGEWIVVFLNSWDMHSRIMMPDWKKMAQKHSVSHPSLHFGRVDCGQAPRTCSIEDIDLTPTIKYFWKDRVRSYEADRNIAVYQTEWSTERIWDWYKETKKIFEEGRSFDELDRERLDKVEQAKSQRTEAEKAEAKKKKKAKKKSSTKTEL